jgi:hypothetical protein
MEAAGRAPAKYHSLPNALMVVVREEGVLALWKGIQPSWLRELSYSSLRFGARTATRALSGRVVSRALNVVLLPAAGAGSSVAVCLGCSAGSWKRDGCVREVAGLYKPIKVALGAGTPRDTPLWKMIVAGSTAGGLVRSQQPSIHTSFASDRPPLSLTACRLRRPPDDDRGPAPPSAAHVTAAGRRAPSHRRRICSRRACRESQSPAR